MEQQLMENCPLPITDGKFIQLILLTIIVQPDAINFIPAIAVLCNHFKQVIEVN
jgi:hypothetical protein